jgi:Tol biopolymer transport system component
MRAKDAFAGGPGAFSVQITPVFLAILVLLATAVPSGQAQNAAQLISTRAPALTLPAGGNGDSVDPQISPDGRFVLFNSTAGNLTPNTGGQLCSQVFLRDRASNTTALVSVNLNGFGGNGNSTYGGMTPDGRYVAFTSDASDLVAGDNNGLSDIFVRDMVAGTTVLASQSTGGVKGNGVSSQPVITPDGRYVAFISTSGNLASGGLDNPDIFLRDLVGQTTVAMSSVATGSSSGATVSSLSITTNGRYVVFVSMATNLVSGVTQAGGEVYVRDFVGGGILWASSNATTTAQGILGGSAIPSSQHPVISDDGTWVAFKTGSNNVSGGSAVIFEYNTVTAALTTVYTNGIYELPYSDDFFGPEMTPDGRFIVFTSEEQGTNVFGSIRLWDSQTGTNALVSTNLSGAYSANTLAQAASVTPDGRYVVFLSSAGDLTGNTVDSGMHIFRRDMQGGSITLLDVDTNGVGSTDFTGTFPSVSTNGQFIAFSGPDGGLVPLDFNGANDVFLRDATGGTTQLISQRNPSVPTRSGDRYSSEGPLSISADGRWVAFASYANDLVPNDTNNARDVFVCDRWSGSNILVSVGQNGGSALGGDSMTPVISTNGRFVVFASAATNLTDNVITNPGTYNIYRRDLWAQTTILASVSTNGVQSGDNDSTSPVISQDGRYVAFLSTALNLAPGLTGTSQNTFRYDLYGGVPVVLPETTLASFPPATSADGRYIAYPNASQVMVWDTQQAKNIFTNTGYSAVISPDGSRLLYQYASTTIKVQDLVHGTNMLTVTGAARIRSPGVWSGNGRFVAVVTSTAISGLDHNSANDVYLADLLAGTNILVSVNSSLTASGSAASDWPAVSWDGRYVIFRSFATNLVAGHTNAPDLYLYDSVSGTNSLLTLEQPASDWMQRPSKPVISLDVSSAVFQSFGSGLGIGHVSRSQDVFATLLPPAASADSDSDGIPDWWMIQYFGHIAGQPGDLSLAQDDPDGTGMTTFQDYVAGTNPTDPTSFFQVLAAPPASAGGNVTLVWTAATGRSYSVQYKDSLNDPVWQTLSGTPTIIGNQGQFAVPTDQSSRYYRIVVQ